MPSKTKMICLFLLVSNSLFSKTIAFRSGLNSIFRKRLNHQLSGAFITEVDREGLIFLADAVPMGKDRTAVNFGMPRIMPPSTNGDVWKLWYHARDDKISSDVVQLSTGRILHATSKDGVRNWIHDEDSPVMGPAKEQGDWFLFDAEHVGLGDVINPGANAQSKFAVDENMFIMYTFGGSSGAVSLDGGVTNIKGVKMEIGVAVSQDGAHWSRVEGPSPYGAVLEAGKGNDFDSLFVGWPSVVEVKAEFRMYYSTFDARIKKYVIAVATATDGVLRWIKRGPVFAGGDENAFDGKGASRRHVVCLDDGTYKMWYEAVSPAGIHSIGLATSTDGFKWTRNSESPAFAKSDNSAAWDGGGVGSPHVLWLPEKRRWRLYYIGNPVGEGGPGSEAAISTGLGAAESTDETGAEFRRL